MAKTVTVEITDDIDGSSGAQTVTFAYQGQQFEIDLAEKNHVAFLASLKPFIDAAHVDSGRRHTAGASGTRRSRGSLSVDRTAVRAWAEKQGIQIAERGRIRADVLEKYAAAHER
jgi:predicted GNAT family acetyltransferase